MLDYDLAVLYGVETRALKQAVRRNSDRFPEDFMFELTGEEIDLLVSQTVIPSRGKLGGAALSCEPSFGRASCFFPMPTWPASWQSWKQNTTTNFGSSLMPFANRCRRPNRRQSG